MGINLVMGLAGSGKTYLLNLLPNSKRINYITMAGLIQLFREEDLPRNIILTAETTHSTYSRKQLVEVARELDSIGHYVYIHCQPIHYRWLKEAFE